MRNPARLGMIHLVRSQASRFESGAHNLIDSGGILPELPAVLLAEIAGARFLDGFM